MTNVFCENVGRPNDDPCHPDYKPSLNMGYPTCTEAVALRNLARAQRASRRTQERDTSLTSTESDSNQDDEPLEENDKVDVACQSDETGNYVLIITFTILLLYYLSKQEIKLFCSHSLKNNFPVFLAMY